MASTPIVLIQTHAIKHESTYVGNVYKLGSTILVIWRHTNQELTVEIFPEPIPDSAVESWTKSGLTMEELNEEEMLKFTGGGVPRL